MSPFFSDKNFKEGAESINNISNLIKYLNDISNIFKGEDSIGNNGGSNFTKFQLNIKLEDLDKNINSNLLKSLYTNDKYNL